MERQVMIICQQVNITGHYYRSEFLQQHPYLREIFGIERFISNQQNIYRVTLVHYLQKAEKRHEKELII